MLYDRYWEAKKITLLGALVNALLGCMKVLGGFFFHSHALVADGIHSFSDLLTDAMVVFASKYGSQDADDTHPYGHQRIETAATSLLALLLILAGSGIALDSLSDIIHRQSLMPGFLAIPIAIISVLANEGLFHYTKRVGHKIRSDLVIANAWHHRSDAASSIVVLVGLVGSTAGYPYFDTLAAVIVGLMVIKMGINYGWNSVKELVDTGVEPLRIAEIEAVIKQMDGVIKIHQLRSRLMGRDIFIDVHVQVSPYISVSEGHFIAQHVHNALVNQLENVKDVTVHVDPEDDEVSSPSLHLPSRMSLEKTLIEPWRKKFPELHCWMLHYLDGKLTIDLICDEKFNQWSALSQHIRTALSQDSQIKKVRLFTKPREITFEHKN